MKHITFVWIAILIILTAGCSSTDAPTPDLAVGAMLQGNWLVETMDANEDWAMVGTFVIDGNSYHFNSADSAETPSGMQEQLCFIGQPAGKLAFEYESNVSPEEDIRNIKNNDILLRVSIGCGKTFLIRADQDSKELYWHSEFSEVQLYRIHKSYRE